MGKGHIVLLPLALLVPFIGYSQNLEPDLVHAAEAGDTDAVRTLLAQGVDANARDDHGMAALTALLLATMNGHTDTVRVLLDNGADVNAKDRAGWTALIAAAQSGRTDIVQLLLDRGADVNAKNKAGTTASIWAATNGHADTVKALLAAGAQVQVKDVTGFTALMFARERGHTAIVRLLESAGADDEDSGQETVQAQEESLRQAAFEGDIEAVNALLDEGIDPNAKDVDGRTALMYAAQTGQLEVLDALLDADADVNARDNNGSTALMDAVYAGYADAAAILLSAGADPNAKDNNGSTALLKAKLLGRAKMVQLLTGEANLGEETPPDSGRPHILNTPTPEWTVEARRNHIEGEVELSVILASDGVVRHIRITRRLGYGLDEKAIEAVKKIRFIPAQDPQGHPIDYPMIIRVQFKPLNN